jgi:hypothetical protein
VAGGIREVLLRYSGADVAAGLGRAAIGWVSHIQTSHTIVAHVGFERAGFAERLVLRRYVNEGSTVFRVAVILSFRGVSRGFYFSFAKLGR